MSEILPSDRTFVDTQRKIVDPWLSPLKRLAILLSLATPEKKAALETLVANELNPPTPEEIAAANSFSMVDAFNERVEAAGGLITALQASDTLNILATANATWITDPATRALALQVGGHYATITEAGGAICNLGASGTGDQNLGGANKIFVAPIQVPCRRSFSNFNFHNGANINLTPAPISIAMALFADAGSRPGVMLAHAVMPGTGGTNSDIPIPFGTLTLTPGLYWLGFTTSIGATFNPRCVNNAVSCMGFDATNNQMITGFQRSATYDGMLADETASQWTFLNAGNAMPFMWLT